MQSVNIGRFVGYTDAEHGEMVALVTHVVPDSDNINLCGFTAEGVTVPAVDIPFAEEPTQGSWSWQWPA